MVIGQPQSFLPLCIHHGLAFYLIELNGSLLLVMDPTREHHEKEVTRLQDEAYGQA